MAPNCGHFKHLFAMGNKKGYKKSRELSDFEIACEIPLYGVWYSSIPARIWKIISFPPFVILLKTKFNSD